MLDTNIWKGLFVICAILLNGGFKFKKPENDGFENGVKHQHLPIYHFKGTTLSLYLYKMM